MSKRTIQMDGDIAYVPLTKGAEDAHEAYKAAAKRLHGEFALTSLGVN